MEVVENRFLIPTRWTAWTPPRPTWRAPWTEAFSGALPLYPGPRNIVFLTRRVYCNFIDPVKPTPILDNSYDALLCCAGFFQVNTFYRLLLENIAMKYFLIISHLYYQEQKSSFSHFSF